QELLAKQVGTYDEAELCKLLLEISLLDSAYHRSTASRDDILMDAAKRYRVDAEKLQKDVAKEFAAKRNKRTKSKSTPQKRTTALAHSFLWLLTECKFALRLLSLNRETPNYPSRRTTT